MKRSWSPGPRKLAELSNFAEATTPDLRALHDAIQKRINKECELEIRNLQPKRRRKESYA